jgi:hypothetical protein
VRHHGGIYRWTCSVVLVRRAVHATHVGGNSISTLSCNYHWKDKPRVGFHHPRQRLKNYSKMTLHPQKVPVPSGLPWAIRVTAHLGEEEKQGSGSCVVARMKTPQGDEGKYDKKTK